MTTTLRRIPAVLLALLVLAPLAACDTGTDGPPDENLRVLSGISFERLFSDPTASEIQAVRADWASRTPTASNVQLVASATVGDATVHVVSHVVDEGPGAPFTHYGLIRIPNGVGDDAPVLVIHHGGDDGFSLTGSRTSNNNVTAMAEVFPDLMAQTVQVIPTYRAEIMTAGVGGLAAEYSSGGTASPWDYDVDDSIALLSAALSLFDDETDADRVAALGFSRGANVALLHQIRDDRVDAVTEYYGPSDFYNEQAELLALGLAGGSPSALGLPGATYLLNEVLDPLRNADDTYNPDADYASARLEVIRRSSSLFKEDLANLQIHHHTQDPVVPYAFSQAFDARAGSVTGEYEFNTYDNAVSGLGAQHSPEGLPASQDPTEAWLLNALGVGGSTLVGAEPAPVLF